MLSFLHVLLAFVVMAWGAPDEECDVTSHLTTKSQALRTAAKAAATDFAAPQISEFVPNPPGAPDIGPQKVEISGPATLQFPVCVWTVDADPASVFGIVDRVTAVGAPFGLDGLLVVEVPDFENPSFTLFLSAGCPRVGDNINTDAAGIAAAAIKIYDAIGVANSVDDEANLAAIRTSLGNPPGVDLAFIDGPEFGDPQLVFRDASAGPVYQVRELDAGPVFDADGTEIPSAEFSSNPLVSTFEVVNPTRIGPEEEDAGVIGDPHVHTFKGDHYTLLREGSYLLWHFGLKQPHVEWQIFAHYSGRQSFTKGLLLVDTSGPQPRKTEITAEQCQWQTNGVKGNSKEWLSINEGPLSPNGPSSHLKLVGNKTNMKQVQFFVAGEKVPVATLKVVCRQGRQMNVKLHMANKKWGRFVSGQLKGTNQKGTNKKSKGANQSPSSKKISMLQLAVREDQEFEVKKTWEELGGSPHGQHYLESFEKHSQNSGLIQMCDGKAEAEARAICRKHLGDKDSDYLEECVFDVCAGGGEEGAEMAAEILNF